MARGGKRTGAGAPRGNINRLKTGERSRQLHDWVEQMTAYPGGRKLLATLMAIDPKDLFGDEKEAR